MTDLSKSSAAPGLAELLTRPAAFFQALSALPPQPTRYLWLVGLVGAVSGISATLLARHAIAAQSAVLSGGAAISPLYAYGSAVFASLFVTVLLWLLLWGLGTLGAGQASRAAEVYGATFLPALIWAIILLPLSALLAPPITLAAPDLAGLSGLALQKTVQHYNLAVQAEVSGSVVGRVSTVVGYAVYLWQFGLALIGFRVLTGNQGKAWRGVLYPLSLLLVLLLAGYLASQAVGSLLGGA